MYSQIEKSPFGNMLVYKKGYTADFVKKALIENGLDGLRIFDHLDRLSTLDFLREYGFLRKLHIDCINDQDYGFLQALNNLEDLSIGGAVKNVNEINLVNQKELKVLGISWRKKLKGLESCKKLSILTLVEFKEKDLHKIPALQSLVELRINKGSIENLNGADKLVNLKVLSISNCNKLKSILEISGLSNLKELNLDSCPNIYDYDYVTDLPNLVALSLIDCGKIKSLKFIERYPALQKLSLLGNTVIVDGDLFPVKRIKSIQHKHYSHYNINLENLTYNQNIKSNLKKIKNFFK